MRKRGIIGTLLLLVYLAGVGLFTGPSLAQIFLGRLPQPRLELIPFADMISVLTDKNAVGLGAFAAVSARAVPAAVLAVVRAGRPHHLVVLRHLAQH